MEGSVPGLLRAVGTLRVVRALIGNNNEHTNDDDSNTNNSNTTTTTTTTNTADINKHNDSYRVFCQRELAGLRTQVISFLHYSFVYSYVDPLLIQGHRRANKERREAKLRKERREEE